MARIPPMPVEELSPTQRDTYENSPSGKLNLYRVLCHAPSIQPGLGQAIQGMMTGVEVPPFERQICILAVLHLERGEYEWAQHMQVSKALGLPDEKVAAIAGDRFGDPVFDEREKAVLAFTRQVVRCVRVDDFVFAAISAFYSSRQIVELIHVIGFYMLFARVSEVAELEIDDVLGGEVWKSAHQQAGIVRD